MSEQAPKHWLSVNASEDWKYNDRLEISPFQREMVEKMIKRRKRVIFIVIGLLIVLIIYPFLLKLSENSDPDKPAKELTASILAVIPLLLLVLFIGVFYYFKVHLLDLRIKKDLTLNEVRLLQGADLQEAVKYNDRTSELRILEHTGFLHKMTFNLDKQNPVLRAYFLPESKVVIGIELNEQQ